MKKLIYTIALVIAVSITVTSCESKTKKDAKEVVEDVKHEMKEAGHEMKKEAHKAGEEMKEAGKELKQDAEKAIGMTMYQCPMKCEGDKMYDKEGKCPKCNMDLKKVEKHSDDGHKH